MCRPKNLLLPYNRLSKVYDMGSLIKDPYAKTETYLMRTKSQFSGDFFGGESCLVSHAPKSLIRTAFPDLPSSISILEYSPVNILQVMKRSPVSVIANGERVRTLVISGSDFARNCTNELARLVGDRIQAQKEHEEPASSSNTFNSFIVQRDWRIAKQDDAEDRRKVADRRRRGL
ncbi:MAG: hypothetical protein SGCHY_004785 [Lobulomycetales sp.]